MEPRARVKPVPAASTTNLSASRNLRNEFGEGFQSYVGEVIEQACSAPIERFGDVAYSAGKLEKRTVDWIVADERSALFLECKAKRLSWGAKASLSDLRPLEAAIENMA